MEVLDKTLELMKKNVHKGEVLLNRTIIQEMNISCGEISLLRTREEYTLNMTGIIDQKKDSMQINKIDEKSILEAVEELKKNAENSQVDEANDISGQVIEREFVHSKAELDLSLMHRRLKDFLRKLESDYPDLIIDTAFLEHIDDHEYYQNTNGVKLSAHTSNYLFSLMFFAKRGREISSFNYTDVITDNLEKDLFELGSLKYLLKETVEQLKTRPIPVKKFTGDLLITPDCLSDFLAYLLEHLRNYMLISGTSRFQNKINEKLLSELFTLRIEPDSEHLAVKNYFGRDGIVNRNDYIFEKGILRNYLLDLYGAKKTGFERGPSTCQNLVMENGKKSLDDMIKTIDKGIIISRFSGGSPAANGDFSGVAKNSFYVENGEIQFPISETMISGNVFELFNNIAEISKERINNGRFLLPYILCKGIIASTS
ncbi:MAG: TldD/PmbA family protein [Halanaerobiaceae bacterium]|jgi:PmbA protein|nr:TldD/PmbA family protein [Halanaerobiaceae bacterium]